MILVESSCVCMPSFRSVAPFFFSSKVPFLVFLNMEGVWPYRHAHDVPLVILILNIYGFMGLTSIV